MISHLPAAALALVMLAGCPAPQKAAAPQVAKPMSRMTTVVFNMPADVRMPDGLAEFLAGIPEWKGARLINPLDIGSDYDREWFAKMGYATVLEDDLESDGMQEIAAVLVQNSRGYLLIIHRDATGGWKQVYRAEIPGGRAMIRAEGLGGAEGAKCVMVASGQRGYRASVCWNGKRFEDISL